MVVKDNGEKHRTVVTFSISNNELLDLKSVHTCCKKIIAEGHKVAMNKGSISARILSKSDILVFLCPQKPLEDSEILLLTEYVKNGGKVLVTGNEGKTQSNINEFLKNFGIQFRNDGVIRTERHHDYHHPKESLIIGGILNQALQDFLHPTQSESKKSKPEDKSHILYPFGCTIDVTSPTTIPLLSTGVACFPFQRPTCVLYKDNGKIIAFGSTMALSDAYVHREHNHKLMPMFLKLLIGDEIVLNTPDAQCPDLSDYTHLPDFGRNAVRPMSCLDSDDLTQQLDLSQFFVSKLTNFDARLLPRVLRAYGELDAERRNLRVIKPKFESPLPKLAPATIPPRFRGPPDPSLELYDLDDFFMSPLKKLDSLTRDCTDDDLECYVMSAGRMMQLPEGVQKSGAKNILRYVSCKLVKMKKPL